MTSSAEQLPHLDTCNKLVIELAATEDERLTVDSVGAALHELWKQTEDDDDLRALAVAFKYLMDNSKGYRSLLDDAEDGQPLSEGPFGPMSELKHPEKDEWIVFPPAPRRLPAAMLDIWVQYAQNPALHPLLRARLADLLWVRKYEQQHRWHEIAVRAYIELVDHPEVEVLEQERAVVRAVNLSKETNQASLEQAAWDALNRFVVMAFEAGGEHYYGPVTRCLDHLVACGQPCDGLVNRAISKYGSDPHRHTQLWQIKAQAAGSQADQRRCLAEAVNILIADANSSPGLRQLALLRDAWALAHKEGLHDLMSDLEAQIARVNVEDDFTRIEAKVEISQAEIEAMLQQVVGDADTLRDALIAFGQQLPIHAVEQNQQEAMAQVEEFPLQHLFSRMDVARVEDQIAVTDVPSSGQRASMEIEVRRIERQQIEFFAWIVGFHFLREIEERYTPTPRSASGAFPLHVDY